LKSRLRVTQGHWTGTIRKIGCDFLFAFCNDYSAIWYRFKIQRIIGRKSRNLYTPAV